MNVKLGNTSDEMVQLMRTGQYDGVSASGDATLRLIYAGDVAPVNTDLVPNYATISDFLKNKPWNSVDGQMYGIPHGWGANLLMYNPASCTTRRTRGARCSTGADKYKGKVTAYDSPIYIADAALYLMKTKPELGIKDPYSLTSEQLDAATDLLKKQRENIGEYWSDYTKAVQAFESGTSVIGTTWQVIANLIGTATTRSRSTPCCPRRARPGWSDTWMVSSKAAHPNCMYKWMDWITSPEINAQVAEYFGEAPAQTKACEHTSREGLLRHLPRHRRRLRRQDPLLDDAAEAVRRRQRQQLHDLRRVGRPSGSRSRGSASHGRVSVSTRRGGLALLLIPPTGLAGGGLPGIPCGASASRRSGAPTASPARWSASSTPHNIVQVFTDAVFRITTLRTIGIALLVTVICIVLAVPLALYMAKVASPRVRLRWWSR